MGASIRGFLDRLGEVPKDKFPPEYHTPSMVRSFLLGTYGYPVGLFLHALLLIVFALIGVKILSLINIASVVIWGTAFWLLRRGYFWQSYFLVAFEILTHQMACIAILGWDAGFQYYILTNPAIIFLMHWRTPRKAALAGVFALAFAGMNYYASVSQPYVRLDPIIIAAFNYSNIMANIFLLCLIAYVYARATITAEEKLERAYRKANAALMERNHALERLNHELSEASEYVSTILPKPITEGAIRINWRFVPSTSVGGDAFGYHRIDSERWAIYLIDVSGHGVGAALLSVSVINMLRSQSLPKTDFQDPGQVLRALNLTFPGRANKDMFFTIWYGVYDQKKRELTYASAGHPPAILYDGPSGRDGGMKYLKTPNFVVGGIGEVSYRKDICRIAEGSTLYVFSDGVYEIERRDGSMWRFAEFSDFLKKVKAERQTVLDGLYDHAKMIGRSDHFDDDFTILEISFA